VAFAWIDREADRDEHGRLPRPPELEHRSPGLDARRRWRTTLQEVAFIATAALLYTLVRGLTDERVPVAFANADGVISFERALGIFVEPGLQAAVLQREPVVDVVNAVYIAYWPIVVGTLVWVMLAPLALPAIPQRSTHVRSSQPGDLRAIPARAATIPP